MRLSADRFLLSRARAPEQIEAADILEFTLAGEPVDRSGPAPYLERFIHAAIYEARPDIFSVVHNHSDSLIPFGVADKPIRPIMHACSSIGGTVPLWNSCDQFGDTDLLVSDMAMGRDLAGCLGKNTTVLMRGHGGTVVGRSIREAVYIAVYLQVNADLQMKATQLAAGGPIKFLSPGEISKRNSKDGSFEINRAWENWVSRIQTKAR